MDERSVGHRVLLVAAVAVIAVSAFTTGYFTGRGHGGHGESQALMPASSNLPFDVNKTSHIFAKTPNGGTQTIAADQSLDVRELQAIRTYLQQEAARFVRGEVMPLPPLDPGLQDVSSAPAARMEVRYVSIPGGARITYETSDRNVLRSLHTWIDTQATDAASHGHGGH